MKAISPSARGWIMPSRAKPMTEPSAICMRSVRKPKSGWRTSSMSCTGLLVTPIFLPMTRSPSASRLLSRCKEMP